MRHTALTLMLFVATSCHLLGASPGVPLCSQHVQYAGDYPEERVLDAVDDACRIMLAKTPLTDQHIDELPDVRVRVYGLGDDDHGCTDHRSGTCTALRSQGYSITVRKETNGRPSLTDDRVTHEMMHVLAFELDVPASDHHRWMIEHGVCSTMCVHHNPLDLQ